MRPQPMHFDGRTREGRYYNHGCRDAMEGRPPISYFGRLGEIYQRGYDFTAWRKAQDDNPKPKS